MNQNLKRTLLFCCILTIAAPYLSAAAAASSAEAPAESPTLWNRLTTGVTRALATTIGALTTLMNLKTPEAAHSFLKSLPEQRKTDTDGIERTKAERYINNAISEIIDKFERDSYVLIAQISSEINFMKKLIQTMNIENISKKSLNKIDLILPALTELEKALIKMSITIDSMAPTAKPTSAQPTQTISQGSAAATSPTNPQPRQISPRRQIDVDTATAETIAPTDLFYISSEAIEDMFNNLPAHMQTDAARARINVRLQKYYKAVADYRRLSKELDAQKQQAKQILFKELRDIPDKTPEVSAKYVAIIKDITEDTFKLDANKTLRDLKDQKDVILKDYITPALTTKDFGYNEPLKIDRYL